MSDNYATPATFNHHRPEHFLRLTGHFSFPCRVGWLAKLYRYCHRGEESHNDDEITIALGIGSNMVRSIRFWAEQFGLFVFSKETVSVTPFGVWLLDEETGFDPYLDLNDSLWLLHWKLCSQSNMGAWEVFFFGDRGKGISIEKTSLYEKLEQARGKSSIAEGTIREHVNVFLKTYTCAGEDPDSLPGMPLGQLFPLSLLKTIEEGNKTQIVLNNSAADEISPYIWAVILVDFWRKNEIKMTTMSKSWLIGHPHSPLKALPMSSSKLSENLHALEEVTNGKISYQETFDEQLLVLNDSLANVIQGVIPNGY